MERGSAGFLYVATGKRKFTLEAIRSVKSMRDFWPDAEVALVTDHLHSECELGYKSFNQLILLRDVETNSSWSHQLLNKTRGLQLSPYDLTVFIDSDTLIKSELIREAFGFFDDADIAMRPASANSSRSRGIFGEEMFYTGVMAYRAAHPDVVDLFTEWEKRHSENLRRAEEIPLPRPERLAEASDADMKFLLGTGQYALASLLSPTRKYKSLKSAALDQAWNAHEIDDADGIVIDSKPQQKLLQVAENEWGIFKAFHTPVAVTHLGLSKEVRHKLEQVVRGAVQKDALKAKAGKGAERSSGNIFETVRRHINWNHWQPDLREDLAHLV